MAKTNTLPLTQQIEFKGLAIVSADGTTLKTIYTASAEDAVVKGISIVSDDTTARNLALYVNDGATDFCIGTINIPIGAGSDGTIVGVDALSGALIPALPYDANGKRILPMKNGHILKAKLLVAATAGKTVYVGAMIEEY